MMQVSYIEEPTTDEVKEVVQIITTEVCKASLTKVMLDKGILTFLVSTTVVAFAAVIIALLFAFYYFYCLICKKKITCDLFRKKSANRKISTISTLSGHKSAGYCDHCKGPCCRNSTRNTHSLQRRYPTLGPEGKSSIIKHQESSKFSRIGSWRNSFYLNDKSSSYNNENGYNQNNQFTNSNF